MPFVHWFTVNFKTPLTSNAEKKEYEGFYRGYVAYHDEHIDRAEKSKRHKIDFQWNAANDSVKVLLDPLLNPQTDPVTYTLTAVVIDSAEAAASDPPLPPPPKG